MSSGKLRRGMSGSESVKEQSVDDAEVLSSISLNFGDCRRSPNADDAEAPFPGCGKAIVTR
ncbi:hypothetical protein Pyn_38182 [Prunus yedoensis var. nudiflora]|uniref:Uncharacterized protein n=1 Tax=Prunus yedoensis var. nudiflora TaxID=2094558 RepID=A0A314YU50_PRUYE|nr:hypothetical protein Pyn_38182 [Prunus yedoensis var. nudiflora]